jgi:hypothetical protein
MLIKKQWTFFKRNRGRPHHRQTRYQLFNLFYFFRYVVCVLGSTATHSSPSECTKTKQHRRANKNIRALIGFEPTISVSKFSSRPPKMQQASNFLQRRFNWRKRVNFGRVALCDVSRRIATCRSSVLNTTKNRRWKLSGQWWWLSMYRTDIYVFHCQLDQHL